MSQQPPTRRDLHLLLPLIGLSAAASVEGADRQKLPSDARRFEDLPVKASTSSQNRSRDVFDGLTHTGSQVDLHMTELAPGLAPHPPHRHVHEEIVMVREGTLEVTIEGKVTIAGPGSVIYVASNDFHGWKNAGETRAHYFVLAMNREPAAAK